MTVADLGCGVGMYSIAAARLVGEHGTVYAIDIQKDVVGRVQSLAEAERLTAIKTMWADIEAPRGSQLADASVDRVIVANVLFLATEREAIIAEAFRILKHGGFAVIIDWTDSHGGLGPTPEMLVSQQQATAMAEAAGFSHAHTINAGEHHYGLLFKKE